jgi:membrane fusion protein, multidrug efflux system
VYQTNVFDNYGAQADQEIARIIQQNAGSGAGSQGAQSAPSASTSKQGKKATPSASVAKLM